MWPGASVCGLYFSNPHSHEFGVGKIERDHVEDYAARNGWTIEQAEKRLAPAHKNKPRTNETLLPIGGILCSRSYRGKMGKPPRKGPGGRSYSHPPAEPRGVPGLTKVKPKTGRRGAAKRLRWKDADGNIYEWDSQHGTFEKYNPRGKHLGEYDPDTGEQLKSADPTREVEP